jgi:hypothetical protein
LNVLASRLVPAAGCARPYMSRTIDVAGNSCRPAYRYQAIAEAGRPL